MLAMFFVSCKKDGGQDSSTISSPFTVKYEFTSTSPLETIYQNSLSYTNSSGGLSTSLINSFPWTLEQTVTTTNRPFPIQLVGTTLALKNPGSVTGNIYINGVKKASVTTQTSVLLGFNTISQVQVVFVVN